MLLTVDELKKHLNIDADFTDDDQYIESLIGVAEAMVEKHVDISLDELRDSETSYMPSPILHAIKLYVGNLYANRESIAFAQSQDLPHSLTQILRMYRDFSYANI